MRLPRPNYLRLTERAWTFHVWQAFRGRPRPTPTLLSNAIVGPDVSMLKIWGTETFQRISELMVEAAGAEGAVRDTLPAGNDSIDLLASFYNARPTTIYGGSNEIQRNILAKAVLRLPD